MIAGRPGGVTGAQVQALVAAGVQVERLGQPNLITLQRRQIGRHRPGRQGQARRFGLALVLHKTLVYTSFSL